MAIYKLNTNLPLATKIQLLNDMIVELNGKFVQAQFDKNEIDAIYTDLGSAYTRKFLRNVELGNTLATYGGWTHLVAETGYGIWKYAPDNFEQNDSNQMYFNDKVLDNRGEATAENTTTFSGVFLYDGDDLEYIDNSIEAATDNGEPFDLMDTENDFLYVGNSSQFSGISFIFETQGSGYDLTFEYFDGTDWQDLGDFDLVDNTNHFVSDGNVFFTIPGDWSTTASINGAATYWIRIKTATDTPVTTAAAYTILPTDSVISLLALSNSQIQNEEWAWCCYNGYVYVTIKNTSKSSYEGITFISSSSTSTNKQNFFIHNNLYKMDYEDTNWS